MPLSIWVCLKIEYPETHWFIVVLSIKWLCSVYTPFSDPLLKVPIQNTAMSRSARKAGQVHTWRFNDIHLFETDGVLKVVFKILVPRGRHLPIFT